LDDDDSVDKEDEEEDLHKPKCKRTLQVCLSKQVMLMSDILSRALARDGEM
jgi:hypothetical protein